MGATPVNMWRGLWRLADRCHLQAHPLPLRLTQCLREDKTMMPKGMLVVTPSRVTVGESFAICVKLRGDVHHVPCENAFCTVKPRQRGPFNLNVQRGIQYLDDTLAE